MSKFIVVTGAPCSGKTTFVSESITEKDIVFDWDSMKEALTYGSIDRSSRVIDSYLSEVRKAFLKVAAENTDREKIYFICVRFDSDKAAYLKELGIDYEVHEMETTKDECLERLENDDTRQNKEDLKAAIIEWFEEKENDSKSLEEKMKNLEAFLITEKEKNDYE
jgi:predicted kinase